MASCHLLKRHDPCFQSPAKVFAMLKSKVQREAEGTVGEKLGAKANFTRNTGRVGPSFTQNRAGFCRSEELKENSRFALTLSPISSPEKSFEHPDAALQEDLQLTDTLRGFTRTNRTLMESTAVSQPLSGLYRAQIHALTPRIQAADSRNRSAFSQQALPLKPRSPGCVFSPMNTRLRKRKVDPPDSNKAFRGEDTAPPQARRTAVIEDSRHPGDLRGFPSDHPGPKFQELGSRRPVILDTAPTMSPAKLFALMKERDSQREHMQIQTRSRRELFVERERNLQESRATDVSTNPYMAHRQDIPLINTMKQAAPLNQIRLESPESQSETSEDALNAASPSPPVLLEDPLVLNSPQISIPKKNTAVFKRNVWPKQKKFPLDSMIHLRKWFLRRNHQGLFVDGINVEEDVQWNSNIITERVSSSVLKTVSGRVYVLIGRMNIRLVSDFPKWFLKKFANGFPSNWNTLYETFLLKSKEQAERKNKEVANLSNKDSKLPTRNRSARQQRLTSVKPTESCPSSPALNVSRSGRVIKPPLEYWKGARIILDAHMNVTVHKGYETSSPDVTTNVGRGLSKRPVRVFHPGSDGLKRHESPKDERCVPLRNIKADSKLDRAEANRNQKPTDSPNETINSLKEVSGKTRFRRQHPGLERRSCSDSSLQKPNESERPCRQRSKTQMANAISYSTRASETKPPESPSSNQPLCNYELPCTRRRRKKAVFSNPELDHKVSSHQPPEEDPKKKSERVRKREEVPEKKKSRCVKSSPPVKPSSGATQPGARHRRRNAPNERDKDEWTEDEKLKLQEAVSCYPKHAAGYWAKVAWMVGTRSAEECLKQHTSQRTTQSPGKSTRNHKKVKGKPAKPAEVPVISARAGTLKRKQQVRQFLETLPRENVDDAFSSAYMQNKRMEIPSMCSNEDQDVEKSNLEPQTPMSSCFPRVKTPQCLHITPGMIGSPNTNNEDRYVYQLQKRMRKNQLNIYKTSSTSRKFTPTPLAKQTTQQCGNADVDTFFVREMFPGDDEIYESDEEEDFYFSDN